MLVTRLQYRRREHFYNCRAQDLTWIIITSHGLVIIVRNQMIKSYILLSNNLLQVLNVSSTKPHLMQINVGKDFKTYFI